MKHTTTSHLLAGSLALALCAGAAAAAEPAAQAGDTPALAPLPDSLAAQAGDEGYYSLQPGQTLKGALAEWSRSAGYTLVWRAPIDLPIEAAMDFPPGTRFNDAVRRTLGAFWRSRHAVTGVLYRGNRVLVISGRDA